MERVLQVLDCAVLVVSAVDGVQAHTVTLWRLLKQYKIPTMIFVNKMDRQEADREKLLEELKSMKQEKILINFDKKIVMIKNYIDENFCDPNIGLNLLSEHFSMNNSYLSKVFKKSFGVGVLEYINKLRIEKSKQMLIDTNLSLLQISESIGYISDITFIRIFKRYEGTTPGKFREAMSPNDS